MFPPLAHGRPAALPGQPTPRVEWCPERGATRPGPASGSNESKGSTTYSVYIARCSDGTLYVGHTGNLELREKEHNDGRGARYTAMRRPVRLVYTEAFESLEAAIRRERQLKRWSSTKKEALVAGDLQRLKHLSKQRS